MWRHRGATTLRLFGLVLLALVHPPAPQLAASALTASLAPGPEQTSLPPGEWTPQERWAWEQVKVGEPIDFNVRYGDYASSRAPGEIWFNEQQPRRLSSKFLLAVLTDKTYPRSGQHLGVRIAGALFSADLDLSDVHFEWPLKIEHSRFEQALRLQRAKFGSFLSLEYSTIGGEFDMSGARIASDLPLEGVTFEQDAKFSGADVRGTVAMPGVIAAGALQMSGLKVGGDLRVANLQAQPKIEPGAPSNVSVMLRAAKIDGSLMIDASTFAHALDMGGIVVGRAVDLANGSTFRGLVSLVDAKIGDSLTVSGGKNTFNRELEMRGIDVGRSLFLWDSRFLGDVRLLSGKIGGTLEAKRSTFAGIVDMGGLQTGKSLILGELPLPNPPGPAAQPRDLVFLDAHNDDPCVTTKRRAGDIFLVGAKIGDDLLISRADFKGIVDLRALVVGRSVLINYSSFACEFRTLGAKLEGTFEVVGSKFHRTVDMGGIEVGESVYLRNGSEFHGETRLIEAKIGDSLRLGRLWVGNAPDATGADFSELNLKGANIAGELELIGVSFTGPIDQTGLTYDRVGDLSFTVPGTARVSQAFARCLDLLWFERNEGSQDKWLAWLCLQPKYAPQPYHRLARSLNDAGRRDDADDALYAARERERAKAFDDGDHGRAALLWALKLLIGYGIGLGYFNALIWVTLFTVIGALVLMGSGRIRRRHGPQWCLTASFDEILPIITLDERHEKEITKYTGRAARTYFYVHRVVAYALGLFVAAGFAGITQGLR